MAALQRLGFKRLGTRCGAVMPFFDTTAAGSLFKPDSATDVLLHCFHVPSESLYRWLGRFSSICSLPAVCVGLRSQSMGTPLADTCLLRTQAAAPALLRQAAGSWRRDGKR